MSIKPDSEFNQFIKTFHDAFGIQREEDIQTQKHEDLAEYVRIDALVIFPLDFNFSSLNKRILPFLSRYNILEYKSQGDRMMVAHFYQYSLIELGLVLTRLLTFRRQDRGEWKSLSQKRAINQWEKLKAQGASHSCSVVILSTTDPRDLRKTIGFEPVADYPHLEGALYRKVILEDNFIGSIATYLVVLNDLPICSLNAPLLLLTTKKKKIEFCKWLLSDIPEITLEEKQFYKIYLLNHHLIEDEEVEKEMKHYVFGQPDHTWIFDTFDEKTEEDRERFRKSFYKRMLNASSKQEAAQKVLNATSPLDAALQLVQNEEQRQELLQRLQQMSIPVTKSPQVGSSA